MPERKAKRSEPLRSSGKPRPGHRSPPSRPPSDFELALRFACAAEGRPKDELVHRIVAEWLKGKGYLK